MAYDQSPRALNRIEIKSYTLKAQNPSFPYVEVSRDFDTQQPSTATQGTNLWTRQDSRTNFKMILLRNPNWKYENMPRDEKYELKNNLHGARKWGWATWPRLD